jgi:nucleotide-binding universal stress UspA family protein
MFRTILLAVDGSKDSEKAVEGAGQCGARRSWSAPFKSAVHLDRRLDYLDRRPSRSSRPTRRAAASPIRNPVQPCERPDVRFTD